LKTESDRRCFSDREPIRGQILVSHFGAQPMTNAQIEVSLRPVDADARVVRRLAERKIRVDAGALATLADVDWPAVPCDKPTKLSLRCDLKSTQGECHNEWPLWVVPAARDKASGEVAVHSSLSERLAFELFPGCSRWDGSSSGVVVASRFDAGLARYLEDGGRVLFLPDGERHSLPLANHWFLRGAPVIPDAPLNNRIPRELLLELQAFDLASQVVPDLPQLDSFDPVLMLWDTHDLKTVKTHGLIFETSAGRGRILFSAVRHDGAGNAAGRWLLGELLDHLRMDAAPRRRLSGESWAYLKASLEAEQINLVSNKWSFHPDPKNEGMKLGWQMPKLSSENEWKPIRIGEWWESQGYPDLDGWAWYRLVVDVPKAWEGRDVFLSFEGVDDLYELFVNGELAGKGGDLATHQDAFNERKSHKITRFVNAGGPALLAVRVYDWGGSGGIFRPVTLGTTPLNPELDLLK
jgi:hypothetical protein